MNIKTAYASSIPADATERVRTKLSDGTRKRAEYYVGSERVGERSFYPSGELEYEYAFRDGRRHGWQYRHDEPGKLLSAEPYKNGLPHGTAYQWADDGRLIGSYTMEHGTGIDLWWQDWPEGPVELAEVHYLQDGVPHGFEWWLNEDQQSVYNERHWQHGLLHGIEREWNGEGKLRRCFPRYWIHDKRVTKRQYRKASANDTTLPLFREEDNSLQRDFPPEVAKHLSF